jgi:hypothetical protein
MADKWAKIDEVFLGRGALFERGVAPFGDKGLGAEGFGHGSSVSIGGFGIGTCPRRVNLSNQRCVTWSPLTRLYNS